MPARPRPDGARKTSTAAVLRFRERQRTGTLLLPRIEVSNEVADGLVDAGLLSEWDSENPTAVADVALKLLNVFRNRISECE
jgi:hypothetical protein